MPGTSDRGDLGVIVHSDTHPGNPIRPAPALDAAKGVSVAGADVQHASRGRASEEGCQVGTERADAPQPAIHLRDLDQ